MVVEGSGTELARELEQLLHRLVREPLRLGELGPQARRGDLRERLEPQQDRGERLVDLVVEVARDALALLLLGAQLQPARAPPLSLDALEQLGEGGGEPLDLLHRVLRRLKDAGLLGSIASISRISWSSGLKRRWSMRMFRSSARMPVIASRANWSRWSSQLQVKA